MSLLSGPSPAFRSPERAQAVKAPKCYGELGGFAALASLVFRKP